MPINQNEIEKISKLARLNLSEEEKKKYVSDMQNIVNFMDVLNKVDVTNINENINIITNIDDFRDDEIHLFNNPKELLQNAPAQEKNMFKVPKVIGE